MPKRDVPVLAEDVHGEIHHARRAWNGREEVWAYANRDAGIAATMVRWMHLPPEEAEG